MKKLRLSSSSSLSLLLIISIIGIFATSTVHGGAPHRILVDTDVDTDDLFAILYLLKLNRSEFELKAISVNTNSWTNAGHAANQIYDMLYMMGRDDIAGLGTTGPCRYRQAIPIGGGGRLDIDTNYGLRRSILPQGSRRYAPLRQPTAQEVLIKTISEGPISVFIIGIHTNFGIFLMMNPHLKKNVKHIYIMGGGVRSKNPTGCCPKNDTSCQPQQCGDHGNMFTAFRSNPYAEFNFFGDPFAAYQVIHSGIPVTLVPLDATNTIPITQEFFETFERNQQTYEAQYIFESLKMARDTWFDDQFFTSYFMWDSFMSGVATSSMRNMYEPEKNEFAELEYINITVITSNTPYGISDGSNNLFDGRKISKFKLQKDGVHSGHVQTGIQDPFCLLTGPDSVRVLVATRAKPNVDKTSSLDREFFVNFLDVTSKCQAFSNISNSSYRDLSFISNYIEIYDDNGSFLTIQVVNRPQNRGRFNFTSEFPHYKEVFYKPDLKGKKLGKIVVFDMDMTTIDVVYDLLHMMGRDDIVVGLGDSFGLNQSYPNNPNVGDCKYSEAIPHGNAENSVAFGAPRDTDFPKLRQPLAIEVWRSLVKSIDQGSKITILTNGPLTNLANILLSDTNSSSFIQNDEEKGNVINIPSNEYAELNMFLDPLAAKTVFESSLDITLVPLRMQRKLYAFPEIIERLKQKNTSEALFTRRLLTKLDRLQQKHYRYRHTHLKVHADGNLSKDGEVIVDTEKTKGFVKVLEDFNHVSCYVIYVDRLASRNQSAVIGNFDEQKRRWSSP
ncbi:Inosine/uridine-preferring nucleoside hydrolase [Cynara cardunculus var. scolymus]|uniref:Inosine/uridine-preferring nucleoside hydrolase n=1 Tax=Cynara cardunculus var. scolymus TaxID=59895 RepID=A0A103XIM0_CYNCS|nr:Inosine/uridine-preferring nucleoside hydrolase [Cynara cardunculus var. scolymus]